MLNNHHVSKMEKLRLMLLYSLRYENDNKLFSMKENLKA